MKFLIVPMASMAQTSGPLSRTTLLTNKLIKAGFEVALCAAEDVNYKSIKGIKNYPLSIPMPLGLPSFIAPYTFPFAQKIGLTSKISVHSFEEVLHLTGNCKYKYLSKSINEICSAIKLYNPDVIYSEFNISAIIAAKLQHKTLFTSASIPTQSSYACTPKYSKAINKVLKELNLPPVNSTLDLFSWADKKFIPSTYELEPFEDKNSIFCGAWKHASLTEKGIKNKILVYMGNGTISQRKMISTIKDAFEQSPYEIYIAGMGLKNEHMNNIHTAPHFDFNSLLSQAVLYINHGGQNSIIDGLIYGVPQLICPGKVFERKYNAESIVKNGAGIELSYKKFSSNSISMYANKIICDDKYANNAKILGAKLKSLGGIKNIIREAETMFLYNFCDL